MGIIKLPRGTLFALGSTPIGAMLRETDCPDGLLTSSGYSVEAPEKSEAVLPGSASPDHREDGDTCRCRQ